MLQNKMKEAFFFVGGGVLEEEQNFNSTMYIFPHVKSATSTFHHVVENYASP